MTHLARNAEAMVRRVEAATRGEVIDQYVGGVEGRALEIEAGAGRPALELIADVLFWSQQLDGTFDLLPDDCWGRPVRSIRGGEHPVSKLPRHRWWEVEVHLVDLGIGFGPADWPTDFVDRALPRLITGLADRADRRSLMAWAPRQRFATHARALDVTPPPHAGPGTRSRRDGAAHPGVTS
jgi:maleylpyruvate isomerase